MAIIKLTKSKKALTFTDEEGNVFITSVVAVKQLMSGTTKSGFVLLSRLPFKINPDRFKKSEVYYPEGYVPPDDETTNANDAFSDKSTKANKQQKQFKDIKVW